MKVWGCDNEQYHSSGTDYSLPLPLPLPLSLPLPVCRSKCPSYVGTKGIVLQESQNTFKIIEEDNRLKSNNTNNYRYYTYSFSPSSLPLLTLPLLLTAIPKAHSVFSFELRGLLFNLHGNHMRFRSSERSARKFKDKTSIDL